MSNNNLLDPAAAWDSMTPEAQRDFGIAALISVVGTEGSNRGLAPLQGYIAAAHEGAHEAAAILSDEGLLPENGLLRPDLAHIHVRSCRVCGCTDACSCSTIGHDPCHWTEDDLCSTCAGGGQ